MRLSHQSKPFRPGAEGGGNAPLGFTLPRFSRPVCALHGTFHETLTDDPLIDWESVKGYVDSEGIEPSARTLQKSLDTLSLLPLVAEAGFEPASYGLGDRAGTAPVHPARFCCKLRR